MHAAAAAGQADRISGWNCARAASDRESAGSEFVRELERRLRSSNLVP
jgi:hypothetical protein